LPKKYESVRKCGNLCDSICTSEKKIVTLPRFFVI
jgi:hypothetical protein